MNNLLLSQPITHSAKRKAYVGDAELPILDAASHNTLGTRYIVIITIVILNNFHAMLHGIRVRQFSITRVHNIISFISCFNVQYQ